jgi:class 3 adenylate cyclase
VAERKFATMVFADLVGSTELAADLDPEELRGKLTPFFEVARATLEEHGGTIEKYIGDAVLAVFGVPRAHGDDPDRAVAAALALIERVRAVDPGLGVRVGVEAGEVLVAGPELPSGAADRPQRRSGDLSVTGQAVNVAARLQQAAAPGQILVGQRAARACRRARLEQGPAIEAKGITEGLPTHVATGVAEAEPERVTRLVGREEDLELLGLVYRRAVRERIPELVTVTGEAGIGKSRLAAELTATLRNGPQPPRVLVGRNPPYGRGIALWALGEILQEAAGAAAGAPVEDVEAALRRLLAGLGAEDADELAHALTVIFRGSGAEERNVEDELRRAWKRLVGLLAAERPLLIGVDDAHWADEGLLDLLEEAAFGLHNAPLMILCTSRPELTERRPDFGRGVRNATQLELRPLDEESARLLAASLLPNASPELAERVAVASGGNPFFAEEVSRTVEEEEEENGASAQLPDSVQAAIAARIDLLPPEEKDVLQRAAVLGHGFRRAPLVELLERDPDEALSSLVRKALVEERVAAEDGSYSFRHTLIRDVAYSSLPRAERADLHERAASELDRRRGQGFPALAELHAFHLMQAADLAEAPERVAAAHIAALEAAQVALKRGAMARGQELYEEAAKLAPDPAARALALRRAAHVALRRWRGDHALRLLREEAAAAEEAGHGDDAACAWAEAVEVASRMSGITGKLSEADLREMLDRARGLSSGTDPSLEAQLVIDEAWISWVMSRETEMEGPVEEGLRMARETGEVGLISGALDAASASAWHHGRHRESLEMNQERLELLDSVPSTPALEVERSDAMHMVVEGLLQTGDYRRASEFATEARESDLSRGLVFAAWERELLPAFFLGEWNRVIDMGNQFREAWSAAGRPPVAAMAAAIGTVGAIYGYRGDEDHAAEWFTFATGIAPDIGGQLDGIQLLRADVDLHHGRVDAAVERLQTKKVNFWWRALYSATRAEAFARAGLSGAEEAVGVAQETIGDHAAAGGILLRARGLLAEDEGLLADSLAVFEGIGCPYQAARSGWLLDGDRRGQAEAAFAKLGAPLPG